MAYLAYLCWRTLLTQQAKRELEKFCAYQNLPSPFSVE